MTKEGVAPSWGKLRGHDAHPQRTLRASPRGVREGVKRQASEEVS
jgi:hypothetical protein